MGLQTMKAQWLFCWPPWSASPPACLLPGAQVLAGDLGAALLSLRVRGRHPPTCGCWVSVDPFRLQVARKLVILEGELERAEERAEVSEL